MILYVDFIYKIIVVFSTALWSRHYLLQLNNQFLPSIPHVISLFWLNLICTCLALVSSLHATTLFSFSLWYALYFQLTLIALVDYLYRVISVINCFLLLLLSGYFMQNQLIPLHFSDSLYSVTIMLGVGYLFYLAIYYRYKKEAFGLGDVLLLSAVASFLHWQDLSYLLLLACLLGILYAIVTRKLKSAIPFAPFITLATAIMLHIKIYCGLTNSFA